MKSILMMAVLALSTTVLALDTGYLNLTCIPQNQKTNELEIETLKMKVSNEDPTAEVQIKYLGQSKVFIDHQMDYNGYDGQFELTAGVNQGVMIYVTTTEGQLVARVTNESETKMSELECQKIQTLSGREAKKELLKIFKFNIFSSGTFNSDYRTSCTVLLESLPNGHSQIDFYVDSEIKMSLPIRNNNFILFINSGDDGHEYTKYNWLNKYEIEILRAYDAFSTITISNGVEKLTCDVEY